MLAGGAFVLLRRSAAAVGPAARGLSVSAGARCNEGLTIDEAPFGQPLPPDSEQDDEDTFAAAQVGGTVLFGQSKVSRAATAVKTSMTSAPLGPARWIGSTSHAGDYTRASLKEPARSPPDGVWSSILSACREDTVRLQATVAALHSTYLQNKVAPPLPAFNKLLELCVQSGADSVTVGKLEDIMSGVALTPNGDTYRLLDRAHTHSSGGAAAVL